MEYLFARENDRLLEQLAWTRALLGFDFDGTLAPIVADRHTAAMRGVTARLIQRLCELYPCAIMSGRSRTDLVRRLAGARATRVVSNLGFLTSRCDPEVTQAIAAARPLLETSLGRLQGVELEDKQHALAIHYRRSRRKGDVRRALAALTVQLSAELRLIPGNMVVNVVHLRAPTKATAVLALRDELRADTMLYVGDDASDEDVFELDQPGRLLSVRVGRSASSRAPYYLRDQTEIDRLLHRLIELREALAHAPGRGASNR
jgi:trehalose 6-phosphate phosphatase